MRTSLSFAAVLAGVCALAGCYDLSAPDGPTKEDFLRNRAAAAGQEAAPEPSCHEQACASGEPEATRVERASEELRVEEVATAPAGPRAE